MARPILPRKFEDRGTTVPFEGRALRLTRLRVVAGPTSVEWEATVAGFWGGTSHQILVVQWRHLPAIGHMSPRDETLYRAVDSLEDAEHVDPFVVRDLVVTVDERVGRRRGEAKLEAFECQKVKASLIGVLAREYGREHRDPQLMRLDSAQLLAGADVRVTRDLTVAALTETVVAHLARRLGHPPAELAERIDRLAALLAPLGEVGVDPAAKEDGFLVRARDRLRTFDREMIDYEKVARREMSDPTAMIRFAVKQYLSYVDARLTTLEEKLVHLPSLLAEFSRTSGFVNRLRRQVAYALDGWEVLMDLWEEAKATGDDVRIEEAVMFIFTNAPLMPLQEIDTSTEVGKVWRGYETARGGLVKLMHGWNEDAADEETQKRADAARQGARRAGGKR